MSTAQYLFEKFLDLLTPRERQAFGPWLKAVLGNGQKLIQQMYAEWEAGVAWDDMPHALSLDPDKAERTLIRLRGRLQEQVERYLAWIAFEKDPQQPRTFLLRELMVRDAAYHFSLVQPKLTKSRENSPLRDAAYHRARYEEARLQQIFWVKNPPNYRKRVDYPTDRIQQWLAGMGQELLTLGLVAHNAPHADSQTLTPLITAYLQTVPKLSEPGQVLLELYQRYSEEAWQQDTLNADHALFERMQQYQTQFQKSDFVDLHVLFINYLIQNIRYLPTLGYYDLLVKVYTWGLETNLLGFNRSFYRNITNLFANLILLSEDEAQKQAYALSGFAFLKEYQPQLTEAEQAITYAFNASNLHFALGQYDQLHVERLSGQLIDPFYEIGYELNLFKAELIQGTALYPDLDFDRLGKRITRAEGLPPDARQGYLNHLSLLARIQALEYQNEAQNLLQKIDQTRPLEGRIWLAQVVKKLAKSLPSH